MISIPRIPLLQALNKVSPIAMMAKEGVLRFKQVDENRLSIAAHNHRVSPTLSMVCYVNASIEQDFEQFSINPRTFTAFVEAVDEGIILKVGKRLSVKSGRNRTQLTLADPMLFPAVFEPDGYVTTIPYGLIRSTLAIADIPDVKDLMPLKNSVYIIIDGEYIRAVAVDGFRAGYVWAKHESENTLNVPIHAATLLKLQDSYWESDVEIYFNGNLMFFKTAEFYIYGPVMAMPGDGYPAKPLMEQLSDEYSSGVTVNSSTLIDKLRACTTMSSGGKYIRVKFMIVNEQLIIQSEKSEHGEMSFVVPVTAQHGKDIEFFVSSVYVRSAVALLEKVGYMGDDVEIHLGKNTTWVFIGKRGLDARFAFARMMDTS